MPAGIEAWLPLFFGRTSGLCDYLPPGSVIVDLVGPRAVARAASAPRSSRATRNADMTANGPLLPPAESFVPPGDALAAIARHPARRR